MRAVIVVALVAVTIAGPAGPASAQFYRWTDERGVPHYGDGLDSVPEKYRKQAEPLGLRNAPPAPAPPPGYRGGPPGALPPSPEAVRRIRPVARGGTQIPYRPGERILVDVRLNGRSSARLLLDTGADRTLISPRALVAAGVQLERAIARGEMRSVTGTDEVLYVMVDSLEIGEARVERLPVAAYEIVTREADGLLGRDFLDRFNLNIDASSGYVTLSPR